MQYFLPLGTTPKTGVGFKAKQITANLHVTSTKYAANTTCTNIFYQGRLSRHTSIQKINFNHVIVPFCPPCTYNGRKFVNTVATSFFIVI